jgi:hypothetical protein
LRLARAEGVREDQAARTLRRARARAVGRDGNPGTDPLPPDRRLPRRGHGKPLRVSQGQAEGAAATIRRKIVDLKAEHPPLKLEEIANVCGALFGRRPDGKTVKAVLQESAIPRKLVRRFPPYHEITDDRERREAVVALHEEGWADKSIAGYLRVDRSTVYRVRRRFEEEGDDGLRDRPAEGRSQGRS